MNAPAAQPASPRRVLFVEDEAALRHAYERYFAQRYDMAFAGTGAEGFAEFQTFDPDILVLDMQLPDTDGLALLKQMRDRQPGLPVIITTAYASMRPVVEMLGLGHNGFLVKPFELEELGTLIDAAG
ncbi:MAG: response regulator [Gemmatimonadetes bacterium]|nr:response regulator [Gemmatimonadota bacterium]